MTTVFRSLEEASEQVRQLNDMHAGLLREYIKCKVLFVDIDARFLYINNPGNVQYYCFLPFIYPELANMDPDDWFNVFTMQDHKLMKVAMMRFEGLPEVTTLIYDELKLGYTHSIVFVVEEASEEAINIFNANANSNSYAENDTI